MKFAICVLCLALLASPALVLADVYGHGIIRFSNNRLNEQSANRNNADRLFDSQNNNRGGYNVGEKTKDTFPQNIATADQGPDATFDATDTTTPMQYQQVFYEGSITQIEWTNQHACGGNEATDPQKINCNIVMQYMCNTDGTVTDPAMQVVLRDGINTNQPDQPNNINDVPAANANRGHHESEAAYYECKTRSRNNGLFHADQNLNGNTAIFTRQNPNGGRRGLECVEERDYYPYWTPNAWVDAAYLTDDVTRCPTILAASQNTATTYKCTSAARTDATLRPITQAACTAAGGTWTAYAAKGVAAPACAQVGWSRDNHLGNGRDGQPLSFNWTLPRLAAMPGTARIGTQGMAKCVFRLRYNISTDDYNPWTINSTFDNNPAKGIVSPVQENPTVDVGADLQGLRLAINTAQFGRTFQDRTHVFYISPRPAAVPAAARVVNVGVRGKRCNIVQCFPAVEYDFIPNRLQLASTDFIHMQWTGSNTHNNGNPGGDGQTGDAGEGTGGTDRQNFVQMLNKDDNYPLPLDKFPDNIFEKSSCFNLAGTPISKVDCAVTMATSGQYRTAAAVTAGTTFDPLLNDAPPSLIGGMVMRVQAGEYNYMATRNNNFSNRSQKGVLIVT